MNIPILPSPSSPPRSVARGQPPPANRGVQHSPTTLESSPGLGFAARISVLPKSCLIEPKNESVSAVGLDYLSATGLLYNSHETCPDTSITIGFNPDIDETVKFLELLIHTFWPGCHEHDDPESFAPIGYQFAKSWYGGRIKIAWHPDKIHQRVYAMFTGAALEVLTLEEQYNLCYELFGIWEFKCTRIDPYFRDFAFKIRPRQFSDWHDAGYLCRFRKATYLKNGIKAKDGETFTAGSRGKNGSGTYLRIYDESTEKRSPAPAIKYECEYSSDKANNIVKMLLSQPFSAQWMYDICTQLTIGPGVIDFRIGSSHDNLLDRTRVSKWAKFTQYIDAIFVPGKLKKPKLKSFPISAFAHQWGKKLAQLAERDPCYLIDNLKTLIGDNLAPVLHIALESGKLRLALLRNNKVTPNSC